MLFVGCCFLVVVCLCYLVFVEQRLLFDACCLLFAVCCLLLLVLVLVLLLHVGAVAVVAVAVDGAVGVCVWCKRWCCRLLIICNNRFIVVAVLMFVVVG